MVIKWWHGPGNRLLPLKLKYVCICLLVAMAVTTAFWLQTSAIAQAQCRQRVEGRGDLRAVLFKMIDLDDVLPDDPGALLYTLNRTSFINDKYPALNPDNC